MDKEKRHARSNRAVRRASKRSVKTDKIANSIVAIVVICAVLLLAYLFFSKASRPYIISKAESREIEQLEQQLTEAKAENKSLKEQKALLQTPRGKELEARKLGWIKEGEIAIIVGKSSHDQALEIEARQPQQPKTFWESAVCKIAKLIVRPD